MTTKHAYHYMTTDVENIEAFLKWRDERNAWGKKVEKIAKEIGRKAMVSHGTTGTHFVGFTRKKDEPYTSSAYKGTEWVFGDVGVLRPRVGTSKGKALLRKMKDVGSVRHPANDLKGIEAYYGILSRPGMDLSADESTLVVTYRESVNHDKRWKEIKASTYWAVVEEAEAARKKRKRKVLA